MCRDRSGIILKNKIVLAQGANNSHSDLLNELRIEDNYINASKTFVRAELIPKNDEWWRNPEEEPESWEFIVDQDIMPDWFDRVEHERLFREAVAEWWKKHVIIDQKIENLSSGYYKLKRCEVKKLIGDVVVFLSDSSQVGEMYDSSKVGGMSDSSQVGKMYDSSQVDEMYDSSQVGKMYDSSKVGKMYGSSKVGGMSDSSKVGGMSGSSKVGGMSDSSQVGKMYDSSQVGKMYGSSQVGEMYDSSQVGKMYDSSIARDFKNHTLVRIFVGDGKFEMLVHKNDEGTKNEE